MRHVLSYLDHQKTTISRHSPTYWCARGSSCGNVKPSKTAPHMCVSLFLADFDIGYIMKHHETCTELSRSSGGDDVALWFYLPCVHSTPLGCMKPSKSASHMGIRLHLARFDIRSIDRHHKTSAELSRSSGGDDVASRSILLVLHTSC